jgi:hypothetical protein
VTLEDALNIVVQRNKTDSSRLAAIADYAKEQLDLHGLPGAKGGTGGELLIKGFASPKNWDVAYDFAGKHRLVISLKSIWKNASGTVPNRLDDLMGECANVQQMAPEIVSGYILLFDANADSVRREDGLRWSEFFERAVKRIAIRKAPLWNQGLLEGSWFIHFNSDHPAGARLLDPEKVEGEGRAFFSALIDELKLREPAIPYTK